MTDEPPVRAAGVVHDAGAVVVRVIRRDHRPGAEYSDEHRLRPAAWYPPCGDAPRSRASRSSTRCVLAGDSHAVDLFPGVPADVADPQLVCARTLG